MPRLSRGALDLLISSRHRATSQVLGMVRGYFQRYLITVLSLVVLVGGLLMSACGEDETVSAPGAGIPEQTALSGVTGSKTAAVIEPEKIPTATPVPTKVPAEEPAEVPTEEPAEEPAALSTPVPALEVDLLAGLIEVQRGGDGKWLPAESGALMWTGDAIRTNEGGQAGLSFPDGSSVILQGSTTLMIDRFFLRTQNNDVVERFGRIVLFNGSVAFNVQPFPNVPSPWEFVTGSEIVGITGTSGVMAIDATDAMASLPANVRELAESGDMQGALAAADEAGIDVPANVRAAIIRGDNVGAAAASESAKQSLTTQRDLPAGMQAALDASDFSGAESIAQAANFDVPADLQQAINEGKNGKTGMQSVADRPEVPAEVQALIDSGDLEGAKAAAEAVGFSPPADLQEAFDKDGETVGQAQQIGQALPEIPSSVQAALEAGDLAGAKAAAASASFSLPDELQIAIDNNIEAQKEAAVAAEPMPSAVQAALDAGDAEAAREAALAAGYTMPPDIEGAVDRGFEARRGVDIALEIQAELPADVQAALDAGNVDLARELADISDFEFPAEFDNALDGADAARKIAAGEALVADTEGHELTFALVEGSAILTEVLAAKGKAVTGGEDAQDSSGIRVAEIPAGVSMAISTLKPPAELDAVIATIAADAQDEAAVADVPDDDDFGGQEGEALQGVVARDSDGDGAVDQFAVSFKLNQKSEQLTGGGSSDQLKPPASSEPGEQALPPTSWGLLGAAAVAAEQQKLGTDGAPSSANPSTGSNQAEVEDGALMLEQVKLVNMVRMVIADEGARKELVASGDMASSLQTALVNISENDSSRSSLSLMARAGGFQVQDQGASPDGEAVADGESVPPDNEIAFSVPKLGMGLPPPSDEDASDEPDSGTPRDFDIFVSPKTTGGETDIGPPPPGEGEEGGPPPPEGGEGAPPPSSGGVSSEEAAATQGQPMLKRWLRSLKTKEPMKVQHATAEQLTAAIEGGPPQGGVGGVEPSDDEEDRPQPLFKFSVSNASEAVTQVLAPIEDGRPSPGGEEGGSPPPPREGEEGGPPPLPGEGEEGGPPSLPGEGEEGGASPTAFDELFQRLDKSRAERVPPPPREGEEGGPPLPPREGEEGGPPPPSDGEEGGPPPPPGEGEEGGPPPPPREGKEGGPPPPSDGKEGGPPPPSDGKEGGPPPPPGDGKEGGPPPPSDGKEGGPPPPPSDGKEGGPPPPSDGKEGGPPPPSDGKEGGPPPPPEKSAPPPPPEKSAPPPSAPPPPSPGGGGGSPPPPPPPP